MYDSLRNKKSLLLFSRCFSFYQFFSVQEKFYKVGVILFIGVLRNMKVKCELLRRKKITFFMQEVTLHFFVDASHRYVSCLYGLVSRLNRKCPTDIFLHCVSTSTYSQNFFVIQRNSITKWLASRKAITTKRCMRLMNLLSKFCLISINFLWIG